MENRQESFRSGLAQRMNGTSISDEDVISILRDNENVSDVYSFRHGFVHVELEKPLNFSELQEFKRELREKGIYFDTNSPSKLPQPK